MRKLGLTAVAAAMALGAGVTFGQVGPGGVVGGARATTRGSGAAVGTGATAQPAVAIVSAKTFGAIVADPIERAEYLSKPKAIAKSLTTATAMMVVDGPDGELGMTSDVIAAVAAGSREGKAYSAVFVQKHAAVGPEMKTSFDEAVRAVGMRYPKVDPGRIEFSFGDKYSPHEGGSAGTCFAVMLLSGLEGFEIDPKCAVTGDITVDWKVRKVGGVAAKVRGAAADKCLYAGVPAENRADLTDMVLYYGDAGIREVQVFTLGTLQDAAALMRKDRSPQLTEAMKEFAALAPLVRGGRGTFSAPANQKVLENIVALAPNHESAKMMLEMATGKFPRTLTPGFAFERFLESFVPYAIILSRKSAITRQNLPADLTTRTKKELSQLTGICPSEMTPVVRDLQEIVGVCENIAQGSAKMEVLDPKVTKFKDDLRKLDLNKEFNEKLTRSGL